MQWQGGFFPWSMATAYLGFGLLGLTLLIGPLNLLRGRRSPLSSYLRRDIGIWCGLVSITHVVVGLQVHSKTILGNFFCEPERLTCLSWPFDILRNDLWGFANYTGLIATIIIALLLTLSNDFSLRKLRVKRWKALQRGNYALFALVVTHGVAYQVLEGRAIPYPYLFGAMAITLIVVQAACFWRRQRSSARVKT